MTNYKNKYLKYKLKYLKLINQKGGMEDDFVMVNDVEQPKLIDSSDNTKLLMEQSDVVVIEKIRDGPPVDCYQGVKAIVHATDNIEKILEDGELLFSKGDKPNQLGLILNKGAFTSLLFDCHSNENGIINKKSCSKEFYLIFSKRVLTDLDYHASNNWIGGLNTQIDGTQEWRLNQSKLGNKTYNKNEFEDFLMNETEKICQQPFPMIEIVFQENIPLEYLEEIIICNYNDYSERWITEENPFSPGEFIRKFKPSKYKGQLPRNIEYLKQRLEEALDKYGYNHIKINITDNVNNVLAKKGCIE